MNICPKVFGSALALLLTVGTGFTGLAAPPAKGQMGGPNEGQSAIDAELIQKTVESLAKGK